MHAFAPTAAATRDSIDALHASTARSVDGSADVLRRTLPLMSRHAAGYAPDSYAVWYEYARGGNPALRAEIDGLVARSERLTHATTWELHQKHLADRAEESVRVAGAGLIELMHGVRSSVEAASAEATLFDARLAAFDQDLSSASTTEDVHERVGAMRDVVGRMNRSLGVLESRLEAGHREVARLQAELRSARAEASLDPLSGVLNRRGFDAELMRACRVADETGSTLSLVVVDIDHFKRVNDTYGHPFGDQVIRGVGQALVALTHRRDVAARHGGEEFALILPGTALDGARRVAERVRAAVAASRIHRHDGETPIAQVTVSAGVAERRPGEPPHELVARADRAMYASKRDGRDRVTADE
ncbi:MAG TPA: GGDEF domain-containing protein [Burkholderiaceae bacterium]|nr:GGDEF domain-containing protein [Burkholderiaceae bacterium]